MRYIIFILTTIFLWSGLSAAFLDESALQRECAVDNPKALYEAFKKGDYYRGFNLEGDYIRNQLKGNFLLTPADFTANPIGNHKISENYKPTQQYASYTGGKKMDEIRCFYRYTPEKVLPLFSPGLSASPYECPKNRVCFIAIKATPR
jgi:hypothetical protein